MFLYNSQQEVFTHVWNWFIRDKKPFSSNNMTCYYFHPATEGELVGAKCAVGCLIPDKHKHDFRYSNKSGVSNGDVIDLLKSLKIVDAPEDSNMLRLLVELQSTHDRCANTDDTAMMRELMCSVAEVFNLTIPEC